ncbi:hypothetical protein DEHRE_01035 [Dehalobacter restrictus DSM 9455]|uniref:Transposase n=1 Tax=Dehalobacter restrictus (strain DSM 9455 / PER-K23) TaxID=871738 RepID=A0ABM5P9N7_DEHRP|nr:hypothetical protein DEHRE_01035 [Dehalobacter restrictus DSM 9455]
MPEIKPSFKLLLRFNLYIKNKNICFKCFDKSAKSGENSINTILGRLRRK